MYFIYGKKKDCEEKYQLVNARAYEEDKEGKRMPWFEYKRIRATLIADWRNAERVCYELEKDFPEYVFESRKA